MSMLVKIDDEEFDKALKRHEENFQKELEEVDIKQIVLKTKKSLIEQARQNNSIYNSLLDQNSEIKHLRDRVGSLNVQISTFEGKISALELQIKESNEIYIQTMNILIDTQRGKQKGYIKGFFNFIRYLFGGKCLKK